MKFNPQNVRYPTIHKSFLTALRVLLELDFNSRQTTQSKAEIELKQLIHGLEL